MPNERLGAMERVVALVSSDHPISRHEEKPCAVVGCTELSCFDFTANHSSRFCVGHTVENHARKKRGQVE